MLYLSSLKRFLSLLIICSATMSSAYSASATSSRQPVLGSSEASNRTHEDTTSVIREAYRQLDATRRGRAAAAKAPSRRSASTDSFYPSVNGCPAQPEVRRITSYRASPLSGRDPEPVEMRARFAAVTHIANVTSVTRVPQVSCGAVGRLLSIEVGPARRFK